MDRPPHPLRAPRGAEVGPAGPPVDHVVHGAVLLSPVCHQRVGVVRPQMFGLNPVKLPQRPAELGAPPHGASPATARNDSQGTGCSTLGKKGERKQATCALCVNAARASGLGQNGRRRGPLDPRLLVRTGPIGTRRVVPGSAASCLPGRGGMQASAPCLSVWGLLHPADARAPPPWRCKS